MKSTPRVLLTAMRPAGRRVPVLVRSFASGPADGAMENLSNDENVVLDQVKPNATTVTKSNDEGFVMDRKKLETTLLEESSSQVPDPVVLFDSVYADLCKNYNNGQDLVFPKEVIWLCGPPGSGKSVASAKIMEQRGMTEPPIVMSDLLISAESKRLKDKGTLVADGYVLERLLREMTDERYQNGVIVDGFPRNLTQAEFVRLLHAKMKTLRDLHGGRPWRRPKFRVAVLWVPEAVSVQRQV